MTNYEEKLVSVVIASYNTPPKFLCEAVDSIVNQTYYNIEIIIIDDCSDTPCKEVLSIYEDKRIKIFRNKENLGVTKSRNIALDKCNGEYIAIMDADDISMPERIEKQVEYLEKNKDVFVLGTKTYLLEDDKLYKKDIYIPKSRERYQCWLFFDNSRYITHPSAMLRSSMIKKYGIKYNEKYKKALDYGLWVECVKYGKCRILNEYLLKYRIHKNQITSLNRSEQIYFADQICLDQIANLGIDITDEEKKVHLALRDSEKYNDMKSTKLWIEKIILKNNEKKVYDVNEFKKEIDYRWFKLCYKEYRKTKDKETAIELCKSLNINNITRSIQFVILNKIINKKKRVKDNLANKC